MRRLILSTALLLGFGGLATIASAESPLTRKTLKTAIESAKTPQDHRRISAYYNSEATRLLAEAKEHDELAEVYAKSPNAHEAKHPMSGQTAGHCKLFAESARKAAKASQDLAKAHEEMAKP